MDGYKLIIIIIGIICVILIMVGSFFMTKEVILAKEIEDRLPMCDNPSILSCGEVSQCLDECSNEPLFTWAANCRGKFNPYVIAKCGGE